MKKNGNRPITEADTDFSKLQKNEIKNRKIKKNPKNFRKIFGIFFPIFLLLSYFLSYKEVCDYFFYFMNLMNSMFIKHIKISEALILIDVVTEQKKDPLK